MKLPKHSLPKGPSKHGLQKKHIKSTLRQDRRQKKNQMNVDSESVQNRSVPTTSVQERLQAKAIRKESNRVNLQYKKFNQAMSPINGPRAVTK